MFGKMCTCRHRVVLNWNVEYLSLKIDQLIFFTHVHAKVLESEFYITGSTCTYRLVTVTSRTTDEVS